MSNRDDEKPQESYTTLYIVLCVFSFIFCVFAILGIIDWYWRSQVVSQALKSGRPGVAAAALTNSSGYSHGYGYGYGRPYGYGRSYGRPLISIGSSGRGWGRRGMGRASSGRGSSGRGGRR